MSEAQGNAEFPDELVLRLKKMQDLRYGENPHQGAALYFIEGGAHAGVAHARIVQGKELSFNNINDADAALECVSEFDEPACVIVKHMNPCGAAIAENARDAYLRALTCDPVSAFGGIVAINSTLTADLATELVKIFLEVVIAPDAEDEALAILAAKPNVRVLLVGEMPHPQHRAQIVRSIADGFLVQDRDSATVADAKPVTARVPTAAELADLTFGFTIAKHVKSNAIVLTKDGATVGIGAGQMSRIYSLKIAALKAAEANLSLQGAVLASDAFFPFSDVVKEAQKLGVSAIIQPGGSIKDQDSIEAANAAGIAMVFTGIRHFRH